MTKVAIYARYSSDNQREASIEDQVELCREFIERQGWSCHRIYTDRALSGATAQRPAYQELLTDARENSFEIVVAEALDRLSRDQADVASLFKLLRFRCIQLVTASEGEITELHVGLKGTMNALYLKDLADKVRRGQRGRIASGRFAGGLPYGYDVVREIGPDGEYERGKRKVNKSQASVIHRIFVDYARGVSPREIAKHLNSEGIPAPRGGTWNSSTITGNRARRDGILHNELYIGRLLYNRQTFRKDPDTGRRIPKLNPRSAWQVVEVPELRIIDDDLWNTVQSIKAAYAHLSVPRRRRPKRLLAGILECGWCGSSVTVIKPERYGCTGHRYKGICENANTIKVSELEERVLRGLKERLLAPDLVAEFARTYHSEINRLRTEESALREKSSRKLGDIDRRIQNIVACIEEGTETSAMRARLVELENEKCALEATLPQIDDPQIVEFHPNAADLYRRRVGDLQRALNANDNTRREAISILRGLIANIRLYPGDKRGRVNVELQGAFAEILGLARPDWTSEARGVKLVVAGEGLEPPTRGL